MTKNPLPYAQAQEIAGALVALLAPTCERIAVAGSLRRRKDTVGDLEIVAIPKREVETDLFGEPIGPGRLLLDDIVLNPADWRFGSRTQAGPRHQQFEFNHFPVDLFLVEPATWGVIYTLRTGNALFSHWLVTRRATNGGLPMYLQVKDGRLWNAGLALDTPEEGDVFRLLGLPADLPPEHPIRNTGDWGEINRLAAGLRQEARA